MKHMNENKAFLPQVAESKIVEDFKMLDAALGGLEVAEAKISIPHRAVTVPAPILKLTMPKVELEYQKILRENGGLESNVPINSPYWNLRP